MSKASLEGGNLAIIANRKEAYSAIEHVSAYGLLDTRRKVLTRRGFVEIPVKDYLPGYQVIRQEEPEFYMRTQKLAEVLNDVMTPKELILIPRGWYILGDIIIVKIHPKLDQFKQQIGEALLSIYPRCKSVLRDYGIEGRFREPVRELIAGDKTETIHKENEVIFKLDAMRIMFSQGNLRERIRMSSLGRDELIVDMFAGIGYFSIPMAVHSRPSKVLAIELNPLAHKYLLENIRINHVQSIIQPILGDCAEKTPDSKADRVVMGLVQLTDRHLKIGIKALRPGGVLHYHQTVPSWRYPDLAVKDITNSAKNLGCRAEILKCTKVKKYSPGVLHIVVDARIDKDY